MDNITIPNHIAVIMDGNGRWAKKRLLPRTAGHLAGFERFVQLVENCHDLGVKYHTVYAFSTENTKRDKKEVSALFSLAARAITRYESKLMEKNIKGVVIGDIDMAGEKLAAAIRQSIQNLSGNTGMTLCIAFCYGGRREIINAVNKAIQSGETEITEETFSKYLYTSDIPDPDLIIRTSGKSGFPTSFYISRLTANFTLPTLYGRTLTKPNWKRQFRTIREENGDTAADTAGQNT